MDLSRIGESAGSVAEFLFLIYVCVITLKGSELYSHGIKYKKRQMKAKTKQPFYGDVIHTQ